MIKERRGNVSTVANWAERKIGETSDTMYLRVAFPADAVNLFQTLRARACAVVVVVVASAGVVFVQHVTAK